MTLFKRFNYSAISPKRHTLSRAHKAILNSARSAMDEALIATFAWSHNANNEKEALTSYSLCVNGDIRWRVFDCADADYGVG
jgi:hypothetical protein